MTEAYKDPPQTLTYTRAGYVTDELKHIRRSEEVSLGEHQMAVQAHAEAEPAVWPVALVRGVVNRYHERRVAKLTTSIESIGTLITSRLVVDTPHTADLQTEAQPPVALTPYA